MKQLNLHNLDHHLSESEADYGDVIDGTEKYVRWNNNEHKQTEYGLVYIHGFSASRQEISPVTEIVADRLGANIYYTRLQGHGRGVDAMTEGSITGWQRDVMECYKIAKLIGQKIIIISNSTGSTLSTWLNTQEHADDICANIMVSPNFGIRDRSAGIMRWQWGLQFAKWVSGSYRSFEPQNSYHRQFWTERYLLDALVPMLNLVKQVANLNVSEMTCPHLVIYSPNDAVIDVPSMLNFLQRMDRAPVTLYPFSDSEEPNQHILAGKACSPITTDQVATIMYDYINGLSL